MMMTSERESSFESLRGHVSHVLLRNGVLSYLSMPPNLWSDAMKASELKITELVNGWRELKERSSVLPYVQKVWHGSANLGENVPDAVRAVFDAAHKGRRVRPTSNFPTWVTVRAWLDDMDAVISQFGRAADDVVDIPPELVRKFWTSSLALVDLIQNLQKGAPRFWDYFELIR